MTKKATGTREWAGKNVNLLKGCEHQCPYCYAREFAYRHKRIKTLEDWGKPVINGKVLDHEFKLSIKRFMYPSTHDLTPKFIDHHIKVIRNILRPGNQVLLVSKPHLYSIQRLCDALEEYKDAVMFRFSITARKQQILDIWEPNAPCYGERLASLQHAYNRGFTTSVSCEPLLDITDVEGLVNDMSPYVTNGIWIGPMARIQNSWAPPEEIRRIRAGQTKEVVRGYLYPLFKDSPIIRWKAAYKKVLGIPAGNVGDDK